MWVFADVVARSQSGLPGSCGTPALSSSVSSYGAISKVFPSDLTLQFSVSPVAQHDLF
jgi:hypothetical protein